MHIHIHTHVHTHTHTYTHIHTRMSHRPAQKWSKHLALTTTFFKHSGNKKRGERVRCRKHTVHDT